MSGQTLLTPVEAAALMGVSVDDLAVMRTGGDGPAWGQWKGTIRYDARDVQTWLQGRSLPTECEHCQAGPEEERHFGCSFDFK